MRAMVTKETEIGTLGSASEMCKAIGFPVYSRIITKIQINSQLPMYLNAMFSEMDSGYTERSPDKIGSTLWKLRHIKLPK